MAKLTTLILAAFTVAGIILFGSLFYGGIVYLAWSILWNAGPVGAEPTFLPSLGLGFCLYMLTGNRGS